MREPTEGGVAVETVGIKANTIDFRLDWDRLGVVLATFGIACAGLATVLYSTGFLIQALSHHS